MGWISIKQVKKLLSRASLTVEAALALPFWFLCMTALVCAMDVYADYAEKTVQLQQRAEKIALASAGVEGITGKTVFDGVVDLPGTVSFHPFGLPFAGSSVNIACRGRVRAWIGYTGDDDADEDGENRLVYVTDYESVYHTSSECSHLDLSWEAVSGTQAEWMLNEYGSHYHACEKCVGSGGKESVVYVSPHGDSYHNSSSCGGLTRHVHLVKEGDVSGKQLCSRCAARDAGK